MAFHRYPIAAAIASVLGAHSALAVGLGAPDVRSYLGRPLDVSIPVEGGAAEGVDASCFTVTQDPGDVGVLRRPRLELEQQAGRTFLRLRTTEPVSEPAAVVRVRAACPGAGGVFERQFGILLDPMPVSLAVVSTDPPPRGVPDALVVQAQAEPATSGEIAPVTRPRTRAAGRQASILPAAYASETPARSGNGFVLKLSSPVLDIRPLDEAQRARLREARAVLDSDDATAAVLALQARVDALQRQLVQLQAARSLESASRAQPPGASAAEKAAPAEARRAPHAAWAWALGALAGLLAMSWPALRMWRSRRDEASSDAMEVVPAVQAGPAAGVETGRFVAPPQWAAEPPRPEAQPALRDETDEAVVQARDLYDAGERLKAAQVLRFAIESHPERVAAWMPLFELLQRERLVTEYAELARGFRTLHGDSAAWSTVQAAGRQIDPANDLYREEAAETLSAR